MGACNQHYYIKNHEEDNVVLFDAYGIGVFRIGI